MIGGGALAFFAPKAKLSLISYAVPFAGAYLFATTLVHLLPEIYKRSKFDEHLVGIGILIGFLLQHFLTQLSLGIEHGHIQRPQSTHSRPLQILFLGLLTHAFLEGLLLMYESKTHQVYLLNSIFLGIIIHKLPAAFALSYSLRSFKLSYHQVWKKILLFSLATPIGCLCLEILYGYMQNTVFYISFFAILIGMFLHISTLMFFESAPKHTYGWKKNLCVLLGMISSLLLEHVLHNRTM